jgi:hypothetical protein
LGDTISQIGTIAAGLQHLLAAATAKIQAVLASSPNIVVAKPLLRVSVVVSYTLAMLGPVLPIVTDVVDVDGSVHGDVVVAPIDSTVPIIPPKCPAAEGICGAECNSGRNDPCGDVAGRREIVRRIGRVGPLALFSVAQRSAWTSSSG